MTDTVSRQAVIDAIEGRKSNTADHESCIYDDGLDAALAAINAIPAVTVTDDMVERAAVAMGKDDHPAKWQDHLTNARAALLAALGE